MRRVTYLSEPVTNPEVEAHGTAMADVLRPFRGRYVARKDGQVLFDADTPGEVVAWLRQQHIEGAVVFRVPVDPSVDSGCHGGLA